MQVRISDWAWLECDGFTEQQLGKIRSSLTIQPRRTSKYQQEVKPIHLYREREGWIGLPRSFFLENQKLLHQVEDETAKGHEVDIEFGGTLKEDQAKAVERVVSGASTGEPGGIVQASPGWGKTVTGIAIWLAMKTSALVIVQREYLVNQWIKRIETFAPGARIGRIKGEQCEFGDDYDISVATIQSLVSRRYDYPEELWDAFGLIIADECFVGSTDILTPDGSKRIDEIREGDAVLNSFGVGTVTAQGSRLVCVDDLRIIRFSNGHEFLCTGNHPYLTFDGWKRADDLSGEMVVVFDDCMRLVGRYGGTGNQGRVSTAGR